MLKAIETNFIRKEIARSSRQFQTDMESGKRKIVGINCLKDEKEGEDDIPLLTINQKMEDAQVARLKKLKKTRNNARVRRSLDALTRAAQGKQNLFPLILEAAEHSATEGEIISAMEKVFGRYKEPVFV